MAEVLLILAALSFAISIFVAERRSQLIAVGLLAWVLSDLLPLLRT